MAGKTKEWTEADIERAKQLPIISIRAIIREFNTGWVAATRLQKLAGAPYLTANGFRMPPRSFTETDLEAVRKAYKADGVRGVRAQLKLGPDKARQAMIAAGITIGERERKPAKMAAGAMLGYVAAASGNADGYEMAAAKTLMRRGYAPVCHASIVDPKAPADLWIVGSKRLTTREMRELAEK